MLLAPFAAIEPRLHALRRRPADAPLVPAWLLAWAAVGGLALACIPALRGGELGGLTLPFWLLGAPLANILWLTRPRWLSRLRGAHAAAINRRR